MATVNREVNKWFAISMISTILFVGGIPMIVLGAVHHIMLVMAAGIAFVAVDFYLMPLAWVHYGTLRGMKRVVAAIVNEHIYSVAQLAMQLSKSQQEMKATVAKCFEKGYLKGYLFDGENITGNFNKPHEEKMVAAECEGCGAHFHYVQSEKGVCPYCGRIHNAK